MRPFSIVVFAAALLSLPQFGFGGVVWNEAVDGDLSSSPASPTGLSFSVGANTVIGGVSEPNDDLRDYMTFTIGPNQSLTSMILEAYSPGGVSFHALNAGSVGFIPGDDPASNFLGLEFVSDGLIGFDVLVDLASGSFGSTGFSTPLGPGTYTYLFQELTPGQSRSYQVSFNVVPEPSSAGLLSIAASLIGFRRRR